MSRLDRAEAMLRKRRRESYAVLSSYVFRTGVGSPTRLEILMTRGDTRIETDNGEVIATSRVSDFIVEIADLQYLETPKDFEEYDPEFDTPKQHVPTAGDIILYRDEVYTVAAAGGGRVYQTHGRDAKSYRIHTALTTVRDAIYDVELLLGLHKSNP